MDEIRLLPHVMETKSSMMQNWKEIASLAMNRVKKPIIMILACCSKKRIAMVFSLYCKPLQCFRSMFFVAKRIALWSKLSGHS